jgi:hypothetical protein
MGASKIGTRVPKRAQNASVREELFVMAGDLPVFGSRARRDSYGGHSGMHLYHEKEAPMAESRHVVPNPDGGWDAKAPGASRASSHHETQAGAITAARKILENEGGGELLIHGRDGQIQSKNTIPPGNDPSPPPG